MAATLIALSTTALYSALSFIILIFNSSPQRYCSNPCICIINLESLILLCTYFLPVDRIDIPVLNGDFSKLKPKVQEFVKKNIEWCTPKALWICDGSDKEDHELRDQLEKEGLIKRLPKYKNW